MASTASLPAYLSPGVTVCQPSHLEGDGTLATEILPGPPSLASVQQSALKRDPRKPSTVYSYLPTTDPGTTYSGIMHGTLISQEAASSSKPSRIDKGAAAGRAQRASARSQLGTIPVVQPSVPNEENSPPQVPPVNGDSACPLIVDDETLTSHTVAHSNGLEEASTTGTRSRKKDKGKGREEIDISVVRIKEEPKSVTLYTPDPPTAQFPNQDHCSSCRSMGGLVYCDGCPRAFHLWCLDPPMENIEETDSKWYCPACSIRKHSPRKGTPSLISPLVHLIDQSIPTEYQLPEDIRTAFKDVTTGQRGAYVDSSEIKPPRLNRQGQLEDRDVHRLRDRNGQPVLCFRCGTSALPEGVAASASSTKRARRATAKAIQYEEWKNIISCDYCDLHWHLDCLDPPLPSVPTFNKKWMCPNHAEQILPSRRRVTKHSAAHPIEITQPRQFNNGNVEIIPSQSTTSNQPPPRVSVEEVLINGRRYRIPERIILLDFWNKIGRNIDMPAKDTAATSGLSSPLTSLSSLEDLNDRPLSPVSARLEQSSEEYKVAVVLCNLRLGRRAARDPSMTNGMLPHSSGLQSGTSSPPPETVRTRILDSQAKSASLTFKPTLSAPVPPSSVSSSHPNKRRKVVKNDASRPTIATTRELRSRNRQPSASVTLNRQEVGSVSAPVPSSRSKVRVKMEEVDNGLPLLNGTVNEATTSKQITKRTRSTRRPKIVDEDNEAPERRGRKRKERDDELPHADSIAEHALKSKGKEAIPADKKKALRTPSRGNPLSSASLSTLSSTATPGPSTPSLKIRLPPLNMQSPSRARHNTTTHGQNTPGL